MGFFSKIATPNDKIIVKSLYLHKIRRKIFGDSPGDFEMTDDFTIREHKQTTAMRFKNDKQYESYINNNDMDYVTEVTINNDYIQKFKYT